MNTLLFQVISAVANLEIFIFVGYYIFKLRKKEKDLERRETKIDTSFHQVVDDALSRERKILEDATQEADQIIEGAQYVNKNSTQEVDQALKKMMEDIKQETLTTSKTFAQSYHTSLQQISGQSIADFEKVSKEMQEDLKKQIKDFHETLLPKLEKDIEEYKSSRMKQADSTISQIIQKVSQTVFNKTISMDDHHKLIADSLEKAKKEGVFD